MIKGLTWGNVRWIALFLTLLVMIASADGAYKLNWSIVSAAWGKLQAGWQGFDKASRETAKKIDAETQRRYGYDPFDPRVSNCITTPNVQGKITSQHLVRLRTSRPTHINAAEKVLGASYCKVSSGNEIWLLGNSQVLEMNPLTMSYILKEPRNESRNSQ